MTQKKTNNILLLLLAFLIIIISLLIPAFIWFNNFYTSLNDNIDSGKLSELASFEAFIISFWGLVINTVLVVIAYKAFKNFDVKKQFLNKQLQVVTILANEISSLTISNMIYDTKTDPEGKSHQIATGFTLSFFEISLGFNYDKFELMCVKSNNIENTFPFLKHRRNPILPNKIAKQLDKLYRPLQYDFTIKKTDLHKNYVMISHDKINGSDYSKHWIYKFYDTPKDFTKDCQDLKQSIVDWFKDYGADDINI